MPRGRNTRMEYITLGPTEHFSRSIILSASAQRRGARLGHAGLIFDRYLSLWQHRTNARGHIHRYEPRDAGPVLQEFVQAYQSDEDHRQALQARLLRQRNICDSYQGKLASITLAAPLVQGLGLAHPTGNGFTFDPVLGVPWMPATAIKGLARRGAVLLGAPQAEIQRLLGPDPEPDEQSTGALVFLDAWPESWPELKVQVMTPHYRSYYAAQEKNKRQPFWDEPHGLDDPVPIYFLSVAEHTSYQLCILPRASARGDDTEAALNWLRAALEVLGAGGKTALGFGAFQGHER